MGYVLPDHRFREKSLSSTFMVAPNVDRRCGPSRDTVPPEVRGDEVPSI